MTAESKKFQIVFSEEDQTISVKSFNDLEIRWFKETDCVCLYKNKRVIKGKNYENRDLPIELKGENVLLLKDITESDDGHYLCQLTYKGTTEEIILCFQQDEKTQQLTKVWKQIDKEWSDKERLKMTESALESVFSKLEKVDQDSIALEVKDENPNEQNNSKKEDTSTQVSKNTSVTETGTSQLNKIENLENPQLASSDEEKKEDQGNNAPGPQTNIKDEILNKQKDSQKEDASTHEGENKSLMETSTSQLNKKENLENPQLACPGWISVFPLLAGKINDCHKTFIANLQNRIKDLREVGSVDESDIVLLFCPIVSRAGTDIDAALAKISYSKAFKLTVLVVLHHTFDPEKTVTSSKCVNVENFLTVDCLFYEDQGLLQCQRNLAAFDTCVDWLIMKGHNIGVTISPRSGIKKLPPFKTDTLTGSIDPPSDISQVKKVETSEDIKYFLSVSGDAQNHHLHLINDLNQKTTLRRVSAVKDSDVILLFCPDINDYDDNNTDQRKMDKPVVVISLYCTKKPESVKKITHEKRQSLFPVDCIFHEGKGLLECQQNQDEMNAVLKRINEWKKQKTSANNGIKVCSVLAGKTNNIHTTFIAALRAKIKDLSEVRTVDESDIVLIFCPVVSKAGNDITGALHRCYTYGSKPTIFVVLHHTFDPEKTVLDSSKYVSNKEILTVDCLFYEDDGLLKCPRNSAAYYKSVNWIIEQGRK